MVMVQCTADALAFLELLIAQQPATRPHHKMATNATQPKAEPGAEAQPSETRYVPPVGQLDEDDEFEEFETPGALLLTDWPDSVAGVNGVGYGSQAPGAASIALDMSGSIQSGGDHLWEDNWDDDDVEDDFSKALRCVAAYLCGARKVGYATRVHVDLVYRSAAMAFQPSHSSMYHSSLG